MGNRILSWLSAMAHQPLIIVPSIATVVVSLVGGAIVLADGPEPVTTASGSFEVFDFPTETPTPTPTPSEEPDPPPLAPPAQDKKAPKGVDFIIDAPTKPAEFLPPPESGFTYVRPTMVNLTAADFPSWIVYDSAYDNERDNETEETWNSSLYGFYNTKYGQTYQYQPIEAHTHWWGSPVDSPGHDAIVRYIANRDALTVNFVVSADRITNMLPLTWMGTTTGFRNPWAWKMEIDPRLGEEVYKTVGALMYLVEQKNSRLANEPIRLHKEFAVTECAEIDTILVRSWVNKFVSGEYDIRTGLPTVAPSPSATASPVASSSPAASTTSTPSPTPTP